MNNRLAYSILMALAVCGCQVVETTEPQSTKDSESKVFTATIEDNATRTSLDADGNVLWKKGDQVSIFAANTVNEQYQVSDESDGKTSATLNKVSSSGFVAGGEIENNVAFYPFASTAEIAKSGSEYVISDISLPATQTYAEGSFGNGAFPMAAVTSSTDDLNLKFKNVLGGLKLQLKGTATIASITVTGNNNEILCGAAEVTVSNTSTPSINLTDATAKTVTLDCGEGVTLNTETATSFIIALPPMAMEGGFSVVVTDTEGKQMKITTTKSQTINRSMLLKMPAVNYEGIPMSSPLTFTSTGETSISLVKEGSPDDVSLEYCVNGGGWTTYNIGDAIALTDGEIVSFRAGASGNTSFGKSWKDYHTFIVSGSGTVAASGNIMSLLDQEESLVIPASYCFICLFQDCTSLTTAPELPATTLTDSCYYGMFSHCTGLTQAPELPATILAEWCYCDMFLVCTSLTTAPELPATTLAQSCYSCMFMGCTSLSSAPELPAATLAESCYSRMFERCTSLTTAPELPATTLANSCYSAMFNRCWSLTTAPELPATTLAESCYYGMFNYCIGLTQAPELPATSLTRFCYGLMFDHCTSLTTAPELPATSLAVFCYDEMFYGCTSLTSAPELPATTLANYCYKGMFNGCTSLTTAPVLPATTLATNCYSYMFNGCSRLNYIKALFTTTPDDTYTKDWVSGVASKGTFVKSKDATWDVTGVNGVPVGWTILTDAIPEEVDLGLPSGLKWASFNLGASKPEEYGDYYAWGETEPKDNYDWSTYKWCNGSNNTLTKYNNSSSWGTVDNITELQRGEKVGETMDDAARAKLGGKWRMPTDAEWKELRTKCTWTWTTNYNGTGVKGQIVTATNGNSIFLPAAGSRHNTSLPVVGSSSRYWSSSLNTGGNPYLALGVIFNSDYVSSYSSDRYEGRSVRPVSE